MGAAMIEGPGFWTEAVRPAPAIAALVRLAAGAPRACLLASAGGVAPRSRYTFAAVDPFLVVEGAPWRMGSGRDGCGDEALRWGAIRLAWRAEPPDGLPRSGEIPTADPIPLLKSLLAAFPVSPSPSFPPFTGGLAGWFGYDLGRAFERLPQRAPDPLRLPSFSLGFYDLLVAVDRLTRRATLVATGYPETEPARRAARARARLAWLSGALAEASTRSGNGAPEPPSASAVPSAPPESNLSKPAYLDAVRRVKHFIRRGDIYQANVTQRFLWRAPDDTAGWFEALLSRNPVPFAAFIRGDGHDVVSLSPERFLRVSGDRVETCPIKGTRPRGASPAEDERNARDLLASPKDRAELVMIVDLLRNDLGRVAVPGSVTVPDLFRLESFATVHHLVSTITARLVPGAHALDALRAAFPGGSITGAPKIRAMEIIDEVEPHSRGLFMGAIGYVGANGEMDTSIAIRTAVVKEGVAHLQVGGGIVHDSRAEEEYEESLHKAASFVGRLAHGASLRAASLA